MTTKSKNLVTVDVTNDQYIKEALSNLYDTLLKKAHKLKRSEELMVPIIDIIKTIQEQVNAKRNSLGNEVTWGSTSVQTVLDHFMNTHALLLKKELHVWLADDLELSHDKEPWLVIRRPAKPVFFNMEKWCHKQGYTN
jgi:hypothetical protein